MFGVKIKVCFVHFASCVDIARLQVADRQLRFVDHLWTLSAWKWSRASKLQLALKYKFKRIVFLENLLTSLSYKYKAVVVSRIFWLYPNSFLISQFLRSLLIFYGIPLLHVFAKNGIQRHVGTTARQNSETKLHNSKTTQIRILSLNKTWDWFNRLFGNTRRKQHLEKLKINRWKKQCKGYERFYERCLNIKSPMWWGKVHGM